MNYYLTVSQDEVFVQFFYRNGGGKWQSTFYDSLDEVIEIPLYNLTLSLNEIYRKIIFSLAKV
jgi:hypothetical protein